ncbi:DNA replication licensing factor MCM7 [Geospiza fortis]|uniref:DNA replication licensing factor MCM7 n=1 Tax=Geospiza fortis TaxID=48883 RepID=A0A8N5F1G0_GEOFO|nr:DNA replication licensing factor MCM7 [Geospiza fortis]
MPQNPTALARRDQVALWVSLDDVAEDEPELAEAVVENVRRYGRVFSDAVHELLPQFGSAEVGEPRIWEFWGVNVRRSGCAFLELLPQFGSAEIEGPTFTPLLLCPSRECQTNRSGGRLYLQSRGSKFTKFQELRIQEHSDQVPVGHLPRSLSLHLSGANTRQAQPGDHVRVTGAFLPLLKPGFRQVTQGLLSETFLEGHHVAKVNKSEEEEGEGGELSPEELQQIMGTGEDFYGKLAASIAPEIFGHEDVKKSLLLLLVGGVERSPRGMRIRGNINICLMGDPGVAKSQLLTYIDRLAPRSQYTTGRGSSGVGLTAAVLRAHHLPQNPQNSHFPPPHPTQHLLQTPSGSTGMVLCQTGINWDKLGGTPPIPKNPPKPEFSPFPRFSPHFRLAQHITYVHQHCREPPSAFQPLDMKLMRSVQPQKSHFPPQNLPFPPQIHLLHPKNSTFPKIPSFSPNFAFLAPNFPENFTLFPARLRLGAVVEKDDVSEALRLLEAARDSLRGDPEPSARCPRPSEAIFGIFWGGF